MQKCIHGWKFNDFSISKFITIWISLKTDKNNAFWTISRNYKFLLHWNIHNNMYMYQFVFRGLQTLQCQSVVRAPVTHGNTETEDDGWVCGVLSDISSHVYRKGITMYLEKQIVKMIIYSDVFFLVTYMYTGNMKMPLIYM